VRSGLLSLLWAFLLAGAVAAKLDHVLSFTPIQRFQANLLAMVCGFLAERQAEGLLGD